MTSAMEHFFIRNALQLFTLVVSILTLIIVFSQMLIASAKVRMDLYNKRFDVYTSALDLYLEQSADDWNQETIRQLELKFVRSFRESQFLFDEKDGIYSTLEKIKDSNAAISAYHKADIAGDSSEESLKLLHQASANAHNEFPKTLKILEAKIYKYLEFKNIGGWKLWAFQKKS